MAPRMTDIGLPRLGILALPLAALLALVGQIGSLDSPGPAVGPGEGGWAMLTNNYFMSHFVGNILCLTLLMFGVIALFSYLVNTRGGHLAVWALVLSLSGITLFLSTSGVITYALPADTLGIIEPALFSGPLVMVFILLFLLYSAGSILFGIAIWRCETLPSWAGVLYAVHGPLLSRPTFPDAITLVGAMLLAIGGGWIALSILRQPF